MFTLPKNSLPDFLNKSEKPMSRFVALPNKTEWEQGLKPAWMFSDTRNPPENYSDAQKMYKIYMKTGKVVYPKRSRKVDSVKQTASAYMKKHKSKKGKH